ncbi:MAG: patatin-like phospholipase family protein [Candidatus Solibacter sp.]|nr:patatin-like phospholipase family protein [Candidatus Solibacter sp.]
MPLWGMTALVLSAGGLWAAWEVGAWRVLRERLRPDLIVGASAGGWNGWAIAGGCAPDELARLWLDPATGGVMRFGLHATGFLQGEPLYAKARELFARFQPRVPFALTTVELPWLKYHIVRDRDITWRHLAACCAIPLAFPPVEIAGRRYVDGGLRAGLPLWAAEELGATRAIALNVLNTPGFRFLHRVTRGKRPGAAMEVVRLEPSRRLGSLRDAVRWSAGNIERWIAQGEQDAKCIASSITM